VIERCADNRGRRLDHNTPICDAEIRGPAALKPLLVDGHRAPKELPPHHRHQLVSLQPLQTFARRAGL
jgi:Flp pilus assembly CpaF family ATPase